MITRVRVSGIGPHESTDLTLPASASITGPSESGKSTLIAAIAWCLWGSTLDGALQRAGEAALVIVSLASGVQIARKRTPGGTPTISIQTADGATVRISSQAGLAPYLGELTDADRGRLVLVPMAWRELAEGAGSGRAFREFLARVLPGSTVTALLAADLAESEPRDEKRAGEWVRVARQEAAHAQGQADEAARASAGPEPVAPDAEQLAAARTAQQAVKASRADVAAHTPLVVAWQAAGAQHAARQAEQARWDATQPVEPTVAEPLDGEQDAAGEAVARWEREVTAAAQALAEVAEHERAAAASAQREQERAAWTSRRAALAEPAREPGPTEIEAAEAEVALARGALAAREAEAAAAREYYRGEVLAQESREREIAAWDRQRAALVEPPVDGCPGVAVSKCQRASDARATYDRAVEALGPRPEPLPNPAPLIHQDLTDAVGRVRLAEADRADLAALTAAWKTHRAALRALGDCPAELPAPGAFTDRATVEEAVAGTKRGLASARQRVETLTQAAAAWATYRQRVADRGTRPEDAPDPGPEPIAPEALTLSPTDRQLLADAEAYPRLLAAHQERAAAITQRAAETAAHAAAKAATRTRAEQVLELVRSAPGRVLAGKLAQLGDMGPVTITATDDEIAVLVDGRPWRVASTGRRIAADAILRAALRRAVGLDALPIVVDEAQSVGGIDWPDLGACWRMTTTTSGVLTVA